MDFDLNKLLCKLFNTDKVVDLGDCIYADARFLETVTYYNLIYIGKCGRSYYMIDACMAEIFKLNTHICTGYLKDSIKLLRALHKETGINYTLELGALSKGDGNYYPCKVKFLKGNVLEKYIKR